MGGLFRTTRGLQKKYGRERVIDAPLSTSALVGMCIGAALRGKRPVCEIQLPTSFPWPLIRSSRSRRIHYRTNANGTCPW